MGQARPRANRFIGRCGEGVHVHVCLCAQERGQAWSDTFIIHYVYSKRNVRIWVISSSCRDLLVGGGGGWRVEGRAAYWRTDRDGAETTTVRLTELWQ